MIGRIRLPLHLWRLVFVGTLLMAAWSVGLWKPAQPSAGSVLAAQSVENSAPIARDNAFSVSQNSFADVDLLANDDDPDGDAISLVELPAFPGIPEHGVVTVNPNGTAHYVPNSDYHGFDSFGYTITDGSLTAFAFVFLWVNDPPVTNDDEVSTPKNQPVDIDVLSNDTDADGDPLLFAWLETGPSHGVLSGTNQLVTYTPDPGFVGDDSFTYKADDGFTFISGFALSNTATVTIHVVNQAPDCSGATASPNVINLANHNFIPITIGGIADPDGDPVTITATAIMQDEPVNAKADGSTGPDGRIIDGQAEVRAERAAGSKKKASNGRVYHIFYTASDGIDSCNGEVKVSVPYGGGPAIDGGALYDSTTS